MGAAENAMRTDTALRDFYDTLRAKGISHKDAKVALARKIAAISLSCFKNNSIYNDNHKEYLAERKRLRKMLNKVH